MTAPAHCPGCGAQTGLTERRYYSGGHGYRYHTECLDLVACQARQAVDFDATYGEGAFARELLDRDGAVTK